MAPAAEQFQAALDQATGRFEAPQLPVIANVTGAVVEGRDDLIAGLGRQMLAPVRWHDSMQCANDLARESIGECASSPHHDPGAAPSVAMLELGPGTVLSDLARKAPECEAISSCCALGTAPGLTAWLKGGRQAFG